MEQNNYFLFHEIFILKVSIKGVRCECFETLRIKWFINSNFRFPIGGHSIEHYILHKINQYIRLYAFIVCVYEFTLQQIELRVLTEVLDKEK